ncbi:hypothetical protein WJX75_008908 [Coccomyxa subellipsoidea]|uniref:BZIP domain-containing protein n=1 Tax=Coccomyxa subellipsoidea TaxID=248742 RepID=A0ABR2Z6X0_9CHLO
MGCTYTRKASLLCSSLSLPSDWMNGEDELVYAAEDACLSDRRLPGGDTTATSADVGRPKRQREAQQEPSSAADEGFADMEKECLRLCAHKRHLHAALRAVQDKAHRVAEENRRLMRLITLLTVNKGSFQMLPQLPASACSQDAPAQDGNDGAASAGLSGQGFAAGEVHAPGGTAVPTSDDPDAVQTEAVAAAALALNQGNPAAALIDLLSLVVRKKETLEAQQSRSRPDARHGIQPDSSTAAAHYYS